MSRAEDENVGQATEGVVIRDRRKIHPDGEAAEGAVSQDEEKVETAVGAEAKAEAPAAEQAQDQSAPPEQSAADESKPEPEPKTEPEPEPEPATPGLGAELEALRSELDERTRDLQRVTAEYANYRKRVDRDRGAAAEQTTAAVLLALLPVLDDVDRAREHGDLVGPFGTVAESLTSVTGKLGLVAFGEKGDRFDPTRHEAVAHQTSPDVTESTCVEVMRRGYTLGERLLRPALVAVADPE